MDRNQDGFLNPEEFGLPGLTILLVAGGPVMVSEDKEYLPHSSGCFLCGDENRCGVRTRFLVEGDTVRARLRLPRHMNGYLNTAHGGVLAGLLDETMGWAATVSGRNTLFM